MLRLLGFFLLVLMLVSFLRTLPVIGPLFAPFYSFWIVAILLSLALNRFAGVATSRRRFSRDLRALGEVDSPHIHGKRGALLLAHGRVRAALESLEKAAQGEPDVAEWKFRLGSARLSLGQHAEAAEALEGAAAIDEEHAYGGVQLALADARERGGDNEGALAALDLFERNHGPSPESAYRRGRNLRSLGRRDDARASYGEAIALARGAARFKSAENRSWVLRAHLARLS